MTSPFSPDQLLRIESLGDNCELGFFLGNLGCKAGSVFRWASMKPDQLLAKLRADFAGMYEFDNLSPLRPAMVMDSRYGIGWHTELKSEPVGGSLAFRDDEETRRRIHLKEMRKIRYLVSKFIARSRLGGVLFVVKSNGGIDPATVDGIHEQLRRLSGDAEFALLEVRSTDEAPAVGTVGWVRPGLLRGFVPRFAPYERADDVDMPAWTSILAGALELFPCPQWSDRLASFDVPSAGAAIHLEFPKVRPDGTEAPLPEPPQAGKSALLNGGRWCRSVGDVFRLHGPDPDRISAVLRWAGLRISGSHHLSGSIRCPVADSLPVELTVRTWNERRTVVRSRRFTVAPGRPLDLELDIEPGPANPLVIEVMVNASRPVGSGERAVVDVSPLSLHPAVASVSPMVGAG
ncbi:hypothetical protein JL101_034310 (plasmid) [Skermanella rosea]|uniref:hypothetical protein n=1 Tax=Skermanella rosea TaxID=1817965 RepID=UPI001931E07D|nr:hypothetical protein [Skermanella rosea]UEM07938.1 hypothetical protein JL101_034310 [Skermanella rosea]